MTQWKIIISSRKCGYNNQYGECTHPKVREKLQDWHPPCRKKHCPLKVKERKPNTNKKDQNL